MDRQLHLLESFAARDDLGRTHRVRAYEHWVRVQDGPDLLSHWEPTGQVEFKMEGGESLVMEKDGALHPLDSDMRLVRVPPGEGPTNMH